MKKNINLTNREEYLIKKIVFLLDRGFIVSKKETFTQTEIQTLEKLRLDLFHKPMVVNTAELHAIVEKAIKYPATQKLITEKKLTLQQN